MTDTEHSTTSGSNEEDVSVFQPFPLIKQTCSFQVIYLRIDEKS